MTFTKVLFFTLMLDCNIQKYSKIDGLLPDTSLGSVSFHSFLSFSFLSVDK